MKKIKLTLEQKLVLANHVAPLLRDERARWVKLVKRVRKEWAF